MITDEEIEKLAANNHSYEAALQQNKVSDVKVSGWKDKAELRLKIREKAKIMFDRYAIYKDNPIAWSVWKIAFNVALSPQFNEQKESEKVSDVSAIEAMDEYASIVNERKDNVVVNDWKSVIKNRIDYFDDRHHYHEANRLYDALININELIPPSDFESQPQKEEVNEDELWETVWDMAVDEIHISTYIKKCRELFSIISK